MTIPHVTKKFDVPVNDYDGKTFYGAKKGRSEVSAQSHAAQLAPSVQQLAKMERLAQSTFLKMQAGQKWLL